MSRARRYVRRQDRGLPPVESEETTSNDGWAFIGGNDNKEKSESNTTNEGSNETSITEINEVKEEIKEEAKKVVKKSPGKVQRIEAPPEKFRLLSPPKEKRQEEKPVQLKEESENSNNDDSVEDIDEQEKKRLISLRNRTVPDTIMRYKSRNMERWNKFKSSQYKIYKEQFKQRYPDEKFIMFGPFSKILGHSWKTLTEVEKEQILKGEVEVDWLEMLEC